MKFARAATGRPRLISCDSSFHGVTLGPLSLVGDDFFKEGFGPLLPGCERVPFGDLDRLEAQLRAGRRRRLHRRADPGPDGDAAAGGLPAGGAGAVPALRHAVRPRRDPDRASGAPGAWFALEHWASSRTSCSSARRSAAATCRSPRWSRRARSTSGPSARSSAATCTSRPSAATACRWPPGWRRCASSSATTCVEHAARIGDAAARRARRARSSATR